MNLAKKAGFDLGIKAAADYLISTAEDFEQMAKRIRDKPNRPLREQNECNVLEEKARLLRGQSMYVRELKPGL